MATQADNAATCADCGGVFQVTAERPHQPICRCGMPSASEKERSAANRSRYRTIVADPPWEYARTGVTFHEETGGEFTGTGLPYDTMTLGQIADVPVREMAARDAHLYLWTTQKYLRDAYWISEAWGFNVSSVLVWCKPVRGWTVGGTFMSTTEFVLFCRRGSLKAKTRVERQWFEWSRGEHSAKPEAFLDMVEVVSPGPYLELFSRRARLGWDTWGNEALGTELLA